MAAPEIPEPSDEALVRQARGGTVRALEALLERHQGRVLRVLHLLGVPGQDRDDVAQEVLIRVFRHLHGFRAGHSFRGWLYRVTVNASHDYRARHRARTRREAPWSPALEAEPDPQADAGAPTRRAELRRALEAALDVLSERERAVFVLRELEGLDTRDVARALRISSITVRRHLGLARRRLGRALAGGDEDEQEKKGRAVERPVENGGSY